MTPSHELYYYHNPLRLSLPTFFGGYKKDQTKAFCCLSHPQVSSPLRHKQSRQSETISIFQTEGLSSCGSGIQVAPQNHRCRPCPWPRHGQQRKWADVLQWSAGQLRVPSELRRSLENGRGQLQVQRLYRGLCRAVNFLSVVLQEHLFIECSLNCCLTQCVPFVSVDSYQRTTKLWLMSFLEEIYD